MPPPNDSSALPPGIVRSSRTMRIPLAAAGAKDSIMQLPAVGVRFYIVESNGTQDIGIKTNKGAQELFSVGTGKAFPEEQFFTSLELQNFESAAVTITIFVGFGDFLDHRTTIVGNRLTSILPVIEPDTRLLADAATTLATGGTIAKNGVAPDTTYLKRKAVLVSNLDASGNLQVIDYAGTNVALNVFPGTSVIVPTSGPVTIKNVSGGTIALAVSEVWWMKP